MNKVILMGRLTRDAEVRYSQGRVPVRLQDLHWQLTVGSAGTMRIRQRISLVVLHLARQQSFWRDLAAREPSSFSRVISRQAVIQTRMDSAFTPQMLWQRT